MSGKRSKRSFFDLFTNPKGGLRVMDREEEYKRKEEEKGGEGRDRRGRFPPELLVFWEVDLKRKGSSTEPTSSPVRPSSR